MIFNKKINNNIIINKNINMNLKSNNILNNINKNKILYKFKNEINCVYNKKDKLITLLNDFKLDISSWDDEYKKIYEEGTKNVNEKNIEIYIN